MNRATKRLKMLTNILFLEAMTIFDQLSSTSL